MQRNTVLAVALAVLLAGAGVAAATSGVAPSDANDPSTDSQTITVDASGSAETTPDQAVVSVAVVTTADDASTARQQLAANVSQMRDALREAGVSDDQLTTRRYDISRNHEARRNPDAPDYRALHAFQITVNDTERVGTVIDTAVENGATDVDDVRFTLSTDQRRTLRQQALTDAMDNARGQATTLANASDLHITGVGTVSTVDRGYRPVAYERVAVSAGDAGTAVESGPVAVQVSVQVTYNATSA